MDDEAELGAVDGEGSFPRAGEVGIFGGALGLDDFDGDDGAVPAAKSMMAPTTTVVLSLVQAISFKVP